MYLQLGSKQRSVTFAGWRVRAWSPADNPNIKWDPEKSPKPSVNVPATWVGWTPEGHENPLNLIPNLRPSGSPWCYLLVFNRKMATICWSDILGCWNFGALVPSKVRVNPNGARPKPHRHASLRHPADSSVPRATKWHGRTATRDHMRYSLRLHVATSSPLDSLSKTIAGVYYLK